MVTNFKGKNTNKLYPEMLRYIWDNGDRISPRGIATREISPVITSIGEPLQRFQTTYGRGGNPFFLCAEVVWILAGLGDVVWMTHYSKNLTQFTDENKPDFNGAYGVRMRKWGQRQDKTFILNFGLQPFDQLYDVFYKLQKDPHTRQALMTLHIPICDAVNVDTRDRPCNVVSMFKIRNGKLNLHQILRSNDVTYGLFPTNVFQWSFVQEVLAGWLKIPVGELLFFSDCLHAYEDEYNGKLNKKMLKEIRFYDVYENFTPIQCFIDKHEFDHNLVTILHCEKRWRDGEFGDLTYTQIRGDLWINVALMLKIYNMKKKKGTLPAIKECEKLTRKDFLVSALEFLVRTSKDCGKNTMLEVIEKMKLLGAKDINYIFNDEVGEWN